MGYFVRAEYHETGDTQGPGVYGSFVARVDAENVVVALAARPDVHSAEIIDENEPECTPKTSPSC